MKRDLKIKLLKELEGCEDYYVETILRKIEKDKAEAIKSEIIKDMRIEVSKQLSLIDVVKDTTIKKDIRDFAFWKVVTFMKEHDRILSLEFLRESKHLLDYAVSIEDPITLDYLLTKRKEIFSDIKPSSFAFRSLEHVEYVDELLKLDAKFRLDDEALTHIEKATSVQYGDLIRYVGDAQFVYYTKDAYIKMYSDLIAGETEEV